MRNPLIQWVLNVPAAICIGGIRLYQITISPVLHAIGGGTFGCRFHPTCSRYALGCLRTHALPQALYLSLRRILKCNPWHPGGEDPVPARREPKA